LAGHETELKKKEKKTKKKRQMIIKCMRQMDAASGGKIIHKKHKTKIIAADDIIWLWPGFIYVRGKKNPSFTDQNNRATNE